MHSKPGLIRTDGHVHMQMLKFSETTTVGKGHVLNMDNFIDTTNIEGRFEFSEWVRAYGKYLDEQLEVYQKVSFYQVRGCTGVALHSWHRATSQAFCCLHWRGFSG